MNVTIDAEKLFGRLDELAFILNVDPRTMIDDEIRLFTLAAMRVTPPLRNKSPDGTYDSASAKDAGEKAIANDLNRLFTGVEEYELAEIASDAGTSDVNVWRTMADGRKVNLLWDRIDWSGGGMSAFHQKSRNARGRVMGSRNTFSSTNATWKARYVVTKQVLADYIKTVQAKVGRMRNGWVPGLKHVAPSQSVARWVSGHASPPGFVSEASTTDNISIVIGNNANGITQVEASLQRALEIRFRALGTRIHRALNGYAEDVKSGRKIQHAK